MLLSEGLFYVAMQMTCLRNLVYNQIKWLKKPQYGAVFDGLAAIDCDGFF